MEIKDLLGKTFSCECGQKHKVELKNICQVETENLADTMGSLFKNFRSVFVLADNLTWEAAGKRCAKVLSGSFQVKSLVIFPEKEKRVTARDEYLGRIEKECRNSDIVFTVGAGTVTDLGKIAGDRLGKPVVCYPTAPSMNGYTSPVAAYIKKGVKLTVSVKQAEAVLFDMDIIKNAPLELIKAGYADSMAKSYANADWKISSLITGESFCSLPYKVSSEAEKSFVSKGSLIIRRDKESLLALMNGLSLGGLSMAIAGKSSPASGGEHLISHFLDMYSQIYRSEVFAYHGLQVGIGISVSAKLYDRLRGISAKEIKKMVETTDMKWEAGIRELTGLFPMSADSIYREFSAKTQLLKLLRSVLFEKWDIIKEEAFGMVPGFRSISGLLGEAEVPLRLSDIGVDSREAYNAIILSRFIRGRLTILDIAGETGMLEDVAREASGFSD